MAFLLAYLHLILAFLKVKVNVMHISTMNILQTVHDMATIINISTANISQMVTVRTNITIAIKYDVVCGHI